MSTQTPPSEDLLAVILAHISATDGLTKTAFGELAVGDPRYVFDLEGGRESRRKTEERVRDFIKTGTTWEQFKAATSEAAA